MLVGIAYLVMAGYLYAHVVVSRADRNSYLLFAYALYLSWFVVPTAIAGYACYHTWRARAAFSRPLRSSLASLAGLLLAVSPAVAVASGLARLDNSSLRTFFFAPLGPQLSLLAGLVSIRRSDTEGPRLRSLSLLLATFIPGGTLWIGMISSSDEYLYAEISSWLSGFVAGGNSGQTVFLYLAPLFLVYLWSGSLITLFYFVMSRGRTEGQLTSNASVNRPP